MATYHVTVVPRLGERPDAWTRPLAPCDVTADSDEDALERAEKIIAAEDFRRWVNAHEKFGGDEAAADRKSAFLEQWQPVVLRVDRPTVELRPHGRPVDMVQGEALVSQLIEDGRGTNELSFDILVDGVISGRLSRRINEMPTQTFNGDNILPFRTAKRKGHSARVWFIADASGPLVALSDRQWDDETDWWACGAQDEWPEMALARIREEVELESVRMDE